MSKLIMIFSDGTNQIGGLRPDQRLSNIYKMYRAMRPWTDSPIPPGEQTAFYDPGLGAGEVPGFTLRRIRNLVASAFGSGIDQNIIDCYVAIISDYQPGDRICLFGFSRGAYTVRSLANVLNLCGVPTQDKAGGGVPRHGPRLRKIASDGVRFVYNHGAGAKRDLYEAERHAKAARFRQKYASEGVGAEGEPQGNVQPEFVGVFDTVAALGSPWLTVLGVFGFLALCLPALALRLLFSWWVAIPFFALPAIAAFLMMSELTGQWKYYFEDPSYKPRFWNPLEWPKLYRNGHLAVWTGKNYDKYIDREVPHLRHALAIDETRRNFARVPWARAVDVGWNEARGRHDWLRQVWFAGNHSDIGGSYPENESRLSDIALRWMVDELKRAVPDVHIRQDMLVTAPDALGLQHDEREILLDRQPGWLRRLTRERLTWPRRVRVIADEAELHPSVIERMGAAAVPRMGIMERYRPENLATHPSVPGNGQW